jgi:4-aminobutyrate aminotransferase/(S)-3-amino-2-methylpropionate transaminase
VIEDVDGNHMLDFAGGIGCMNVGHSAPEVVQAAKSQLERFTHGCFHVTPYDAYVRLAEELNRRSPGTFSKKTLLVNSGAEAVENAIKIARAYTGKPAIICFEHAFHGRTLLAMSVTSKTHPYKAGFGPFAPEIYRIPYPYCYRCPNCKEDAAECPLHSAQQLESAFKNIVAVESVAAVLIEPILGEGGFVVPPPEFLQALTSICHRNNILLIVDEVQSGYGRTGTLFVSEQFGLEPDLLVAGKSIAAGLPLASVTGRAEIMDAPMVGGLGGTYGGNPVACEAALAVLDAIDKGGLLKRARELGDLIERRFRSMLERFELVGDVRGIGAMQALELVRNRDSREPAREETEAIIKECYQHGVVLISAGTYGNIIRLLIPLVLTDEQLEEGLTVIEEAIARVTKPQAVSA